MPPRRTSTQGEDVTRPPRSSARGVTHGLARFSVFIMKMYLDIAQFISPVPDCGCSYRVRRLLLMSVVFAAATLVRPADAQTATSAVTSIGFASAAVTAKKLYDR